MFVLVYFPVVMTVVSRNLLSPSANQAKKMNATSIVVTLANRFTLY